MEGVISSFRGSHKTMTGNQMVIVVNSISSKDKAQSLVGKSVIYDCPGKQKKQIKGKVSNTHGNKGAVRALFEKGMPGQSVGQKVKIE